MHYSYPKLKISNYPKAEIKSTSLVINIMEAWFQEFRQKNLCHE